MGAPWIMFLGAWFGVGGLGSFPSRAGGQVRVTPPFPGYSQQVGPSYLDVLVEPVASRLGQCLRGRL